MIHVEHTSFAILTFLSLLEAILLAISFCLCRRRRVQIAFAFAQAFRLWTACRLDLRREMKRYDQRDRPCLEVWRHRRQWDHPLREIYRHPVGVLTQGDSVVVDPSWGDLLWGDLEPLFCLPLVDRHRVVHVLVRHGYVVHRWLCRRLVAYDFDARTAAARSRVASAMFRGRRPKSLPGHIRNGIGRPQPLRPRRSIGLKRGEVP